VPTKDGGARLSDTTYALLGLLTFGEQSGYDLLKLANRSIASFFRVPSKSQIYAELRRLTELGYASEREIIQRRRPNKRLYRITPDGETTLRDWLETSEPEPFGGLFLLQLMLGRHMRPQTAVARVEAMRAMAHEEIERLRDSEQRLAGSEERLFPYLLVTGRIAMLEACVAWADEALDVLKRRARGAPKKKR
jgi:PadR family transcriptional regulator AphA